MTFVNGTPEVLRRLGEQANHQHAMEMIEDGSSPIETWEETGWGLTPYGQLEYKLSDESFKLTDAIGPDPIPLNQAIIHDELFNIVPEVNQYTIREMDPWEVIYYDGLMGGQVKGFTNPTPGMREVAIRPDMSEEQTLHTVAHEVLGHGVQDVLNFPNNADGSNPVIAGGFGEYQAEYGELAAQEIAYDILDETFDDGEAPDHVLTAEAAGTDEITVQPPSLYQ
jgi:hypothetical protein